MNLRGLNDKVVIVTGAAAGIGRATARRFAEEGCRVAAWDMNATSQEEICHELRHEENRGLFRKTNVADAEDVEAAVAELVDRWGRVDVLINNAGILRDDQLVKWKDGEIAKVMSDETFDAVISVNLKGVFHCARAVVPHMIRGGGGCHSECFFDRRTVRQFWADELCGSKSWSDRVYTNLVSRTGQTQYSSECGRARFHRHRNDSQHA